MGRAQYVTCGGRGFDDTGGMWLFYLLHSNQLDLGSNVFTLLISNQQQQKRKKNPYAFLSLFANWLYEGIISGTLDRVGSIREFSFM